MQNTQEKGPVVPEASTAVSLDNHQVREEDGNLIESEGISVFQQRIGKDR